MLIVLLIIIIRIVSSRQVLAGRLEIILGLWVDVLVIVLGLLLLILLLLLLLILLLLWLLFILLLLILLGWSSRLLVLVVRNVRTTTVVTVGIIIQLDTRPTGSAVRSTAIAVRTSRVETVPTTTMVMRRPRGVVRWSGRVMRWTLVMMWTFVVMGMVTLVVVVRMIDLWRGAHVRMLVVVFVIKRLFDSVLLCMEQMSDLIDQMLVRSDVQIDQRLQNLLAVVVLCDLERDQGVYVYWA